MKICSVHGTEMVLKQGVSKTTNKPYSFEACPTRNADGSYCRAKPVDQGNSKSIEAWQHSLETPPARDFDKEARGKTKCAIVCAVIQHGGLEALKDQLPTIDKMVNFIMSSQVTSVEDQ